MSPAMRKYMRQHYGTDDVRKLQRALNVEAGSTIDSAAKLAGLRSPGGVVRARPKVSPSSEDMLQRQMRKGVRGMRQSESLTGLLGGARNKQGTASTPTLPSIKVASGAASSPGALKLRESAFASKAGATGKDERKREALRAVLFKKLMAKYGGRVRVCMNGMCRSDEKLACHMLLPLCTDSPHAQGNGSDCHHTGRHNWGRQRGR